MYITYISYIPKHHGGFLFILLSVLRLGVTASHVLSMCATVESWDGNFTCLLCACDCHLRPAMEFFIFPVSSQNS